MSIPRIREKFGSAFQVLVVLVYTLAFPNMKKERASGKHKANTHSYRSLADYRERASNQDMPKCSTCQPTGLNTIGQNTLDFQHLMPAELVSTRTQESVFDSTYIDVGHRFIIFILVRCPCVATTRPIQQNVRTQRLHKNE